MCISKLPMDRGELGAYKVGFWVGILGRDLGLGVDLGLHLNCFILISVGFGSVQGSFGNMGFRWVRVKTLGKMNPGVFRGMLSTAHLLYITKPFLARVLLLTTFVSIPVKKFK